MSGIIDDAGVQWEHCNICTKFVQLDRLGFEHPSPDYQYGRMVCIKCIDKVVDIELVDPAASWVPVYG